MSDRAYISNIHAVWTIAAQEEALAKVVPGWPKVAVYKDELGPSKRQGQLPSSLVQRAAMLRPIGRKGDAETIWVADLSVLAWKGVDFLSVLAGAVERNATVVAVDTGTRIPPNAGAAALRDAQAEFVKSRQRTATGGRMIGAKASKIAREADTQRRLDLIRADWPHQAHTTAELLARAARVPPGRRTPIPMAYATAVKHLGHRPLVQARAIGEARRQVAYAEAVEERKAKAAARAARKTAKETTNGQA